MNTSRSRRNKQPFTLFPQPQEPIVPMPTTAKWPKPLSEDEFEDMSVDFLRLPTATVDSSTCSNESKCGAN